MNDNKDSSFDIKLRNLIFNTVFLGMLRLIAFDVMAMISDILTALMLYFYATAKTKCMAILTMINGVLGLLYGGFRFTTYAMVFKTEASPYAFVLLAIAIYGLAVYSFICYYAYYGLRNFSNNLMPQLESGTGNNDIESNYGAIPNSKPRYTAFSGKGTSVGQ
jgi:hypothetical protein